MAWHWKIIGGALVIWGLDTATPPYPTSDALYILPVFLLIYGVHSWQQLLSLQLIAAYIITCVAVGLLIAAAGGIILWLC